jgi:hypothetical protein
MSIVNLYLWLIFTQLGLNPPISDLGCWFQNSCAIIKTTNQVIVVHKKGH